MIATTIEQSKHLLELGLDPKTADMCLCKTAQGTWVLYGYVPSEYDAHTIPAWSLSVLLEVMPADIKLDGIQYYFHLEKNNGFYTVSYYFDDVDELYTLNTTKVCEMPIVAAYEMVCWLLEQGLIKKGDEK